MKSIGARVIQQEHLHSGRVEEVGAVLEAEFGGRGTRAHVLCHGRALAVVWSGIATEKAPTDEVREHGRLIAPVVRRLNGLCRSGHGPIPAYDPLAMWIPSWRYDVDLWLPKGETNGRFIRRDLQRLIRSAGTFELKCCFATLCLRRCCDSANRLLRSGTYV
jgi:hypothetical protein